MEFLSALATESELDALIDDGAIEDSNWSFLESSGLI